MEKDERQRLEKKAEEHYNNYILAVNSYENEKKKTYGLRERVKHLEDRCIELESRIEALLRRFETGV